MRRFLKNHSSLFWAPYLLLGLMLLARLIPFQLFDVPYSTIVYDAKGNLMGANIAEDYQWRFPASDSLDVQFCNALLLYEDEYFYIHPGFNLFSILRSIKQNSVAGRVKSGGSTISMQLARMAYPGKRTMSNKIKELLMAIFLELRYSKKEILQLYVAHAPFGGNTVGVDAAAQRYYGRSLHLLGWGEKAALAVLPNSPALVHPGKNQQILLRKRNFLLQKLYKNGQIDEETLRLSLREPLPAKPQPLPIVSPHLVQKLAISHSGGNYYTTLDFVLQQRANQIVAQHMSQHIQNKVYNAAALIVEVETGNVLAYVGNNPNIKNGFSHFVDIPDAERSSGSVLKPLLYAASLDDGLILPGSLLPDIPSYYNGFSPQNFNKKYDGAIAADKALARSLNVPAVRMLQKYGVERFKSLLEKSGFSTLKYPSSHYGLSLILGGAEVKLSELASVYASLARVLKHYPISQGSYSDNDYHSINFFQHEEKIWYSTSEPTCFSAGAIYATFQAMRSLQRPAEEAGWESFASARPIAWKTGTSFGFRDAWAVGITPHYVVAVWVGNANGEGRSGITGGSTAAPIMFDIFRLLKYDGWFEFPQQDMARIAVCKNSGYRAGVNCPVDSQWIPKSALNAPVCFNHQLIHLSSDELFRVNHKCYPVSQMHHRAWFVLPPVQEYYYKMVHPDYRSLPPWQEGCTSEANNPIQLIYPTPNTLIAVPLDFNSTPMPIVYKAAHGQKNARLFWYLDEQFIGETNGIHQLENIPTQGKHFLTIIDDEGNRISCNFESSLCQLKSPLFNKK